MIKKTIEYTDFNGEPATDDFYFHMSRADLAKMELGAGGFEEYMKRIIRAQDGQQIIDVVEKIVKGSYGERSADGSKFTKNDKVLEAFTSSGAYDALFYELVTDAEKSAEFMQGVLPAELVAVTQAKEALLARPHISQNLAEHLSDEQLVQAGAEEPQLTEAQFRGVTPTLSIVDETADFGGRPKNKNLSKRVLVARQRVKQGHIVPIDSELLDALTPAELEKALENGCELV
jgi:hypothetical protein